MSVCASYTSILSVVEFCRNEREQAIKCFRVPTQSVLQEVVRGAKAKRKGGDNLPGVRSPPCRGTGSKRTSALMLSKTTKFHVLFKGEIKAQCDSRVLFFGLELPSFTFFDSATLAQQTDNFFCWLRLQVMIRAAKSTPPFSIDNLNSATFSTQAHSHSRSIWPFEKRLFDI